MRGILCGEVGPGMTMIPFMESVAKRAGTEAMAYFHHLKANAVSVKASAKDLVSTADKAVEKVIINMIRERYPEDCFFGEESGRSNTSSEYCWVIDPIDGTQSFVKNHPYFSISIALKKNGSALAGCVHAPVLGLTFSGEVGRGAFENGVPIRVSDCTILAEAACSTGFACVRAGLKKNNLPYFNAIVPEIRDIKRCGSAALDLCFVASGRYDAYWELCLQEYDVAAGALICALAGARVCDLCGGMEYPAKGILCGNPALVERFLPYFQEKSR